MADVLQRLRGDREVAARGELTLDRDRARQRLRMFRLADPHHYVLQFVRAASVLGATKVEFGVAPRGTVCTFDAVLAAEPLVDIWSAAFDRRTTPAQLALHNVALGLSSAQALNPSSIVLESGRVKLILTDTDETYQEFDRPVFDGTRITVQEKFKLGHIAEFFTTFLGELPEERALRERCLRAQIEVVVNERRTSLDRTKLSGPQQTSTTDDADCWVSLVEGDEAVSFTLLRDDVRVWHRAADSLGFGAIAVMNSRVVETDLSGLDVQKLPRHFRRDLYDLYHRAVQELLQKRIASTYNQPPDDRLRAVIHRLAKHIRDVGRANVGAGTRRLMEFLAEQPLFTAGLVGAGESRISLSDATRDGAVSFCTRPIRLPDADAKVILARDDGADLRAYADAGYAIRDVTIEFANLARRRRNELRWQARPVRAVDDVGDDVIELKQNRLRGTVEPTDVGDGQGELFLGGRMLRACSGFLPFRFTVDGDLEPDEYFENVERDERFDEFAIALLSASKRHFTNFEGRPIEALAVLAHLASDSYELEVLGMLGYGPTEAAKLLRRGGVRRETDEFAQAVLRESGALADAKLFFCRPDRHCSLREIVESPDAPMFVQSFEKFHDQPRLMLELDRDEMKLVSLLRPDAGPATKVLQREGAREWFLAQPKFRPPADRNALRTRKVVVGDARIDLRLVAGRVLGRAEVYIIQDERLLARHRWAGPAGGWHVVVESDSLGPTDAYDDVLRDTHFKAIQRTFAREAQSVLEEWRRSVVESNELPPRAMDLFVELNLGVAEQHMVLPAWRYVGESWVPVLVDSDTILASATEGTLFCASSGTITGTHPQGRLVLYLRDAADLARLPKRLRELRFVDVFTAAVEDGNRWLKTAALPVDHRQALATSSAPMSFARAHDPEALTATTGLYAAGSPSHVVEFVWSDRVVETVELPTPLGRFRTVVSGSRLEPDAAYTRIATGRDEALRLARGGEARVIARARILIKSKESRFDSTPLRRELFRLQKAAAALDDPPSWSLDLPAETSFPTVSDRAATELDAAMAWLSHARDDRRHLLDDFMLASASWTDVQGRFCHASERGIAVQRDHALLALVDVRDPTSVAFLASCICTEINAYYREISDADELQLQHALLKAGR